LVLPPKPPTPTRSRHALNQWESDMISKIEEYTGQPYTGPTTPITKEMVQQAYDDNWARWLEANNLDTGAA